MARNIGLGSGMRTGFVFLLGVLALAVSGAPLDQAPDERAELYGWMDSLGYRVAIAKPFVQVEVWQKQDDGKPRLSYSVQGFLTESSGRTYRCLTPELREHDFPGRWASVEQVKRVPENLREWCERKLIPSKTSGSYRDFGSFFGPPPQLEFFVASYACELRGWHDLSKRLFAESQRRFRPGSREPDPGEPTFAESIRQLVASAEFEEVISMFNDVTKARPVLLARIREFRSRFPSYRPRRIEKDGVDGIKEIEDELARMIREDEEHAKKPSVPLEQLSVSERVAELIYQLRNTHAQQMSNPGFPDFVEAWDNRGEQSVGKQLVAIGNDAVPKLIEALQNKGYTRARAWNRVEPYSLVRIRDAALQILNAIAKRTFTTTRESGEEKPYDEDAEFAELQSQALAWWREIHEKGERVVWSAAVRKGDWDGAQQAESLAKKFPRDAVPAIRYALAHLAEESYAENFLRSLAIVNTPEARALIDETLAHPLSTARLAAAKEIALRDPERALDAMIREYTRTLEPDEELIGFLIGSGRLRAVQAIAKDLRRRLSSTRFAVVHVLMRGGLPPSWVGFPEETALKAGPAYIAAVEQLLVSLLMDKTVISSWMTLGNETGTITFNNPEIGDLAAYALGESLPEKYKYVQRHSPSQTRLQGLRFANLWRNERKMGMLPEPKRPPVPRASAAIFDPLLRRALQGSPAERSNALARIEALGLSALGPTLKALEGENPFSAAYADLKAVARRLSCVVSQVEIDRAPVRAKRLVSKAKSLAGKELTVTRFLDLIRAAIRQWTPAQGLVTMTASRDSDGRGFVLTVRFGGPDSGRGLNQLDYGTFIAVDGAVLGGGTGATSADYLLGPGGLDDFAATLRHALESEPQQVLTLSFSFSGK